MASNGKTMGKPGFSFGRDTKRGTNRTGHNPPAAKGPGVAAVKASVARVAAARASGKVNPGNLRDVFRALGKSASGAVKAGASKARA